MRQDVSENPTKVVYRGKLCFPKTVRTLTPAQREAVFERDNRECLYCGSPAEHVDHIVPCSWAPDDSMENLASSCAFCNLVCGNKMFKSFTHKKLYALDAQMQMAKRGHVKVWTKGEMEKLGPTLRSSVASSCVVVATEEEQVRVQQRLDEILVRFRENFRRTLLETGV